MLSNVRHTRRTPTTLVLPLDFELPHCPLEDLFVAVREFLDVVTDELREIDVDLVGVLQFVVEGVHLLVDRDSMVFSFAPALSTS